jgi:pyruvate/2-oxoglutarate/acetoin dehydrogenase E1 component
MSITYLEAIREAQAKLLRDDKRVFIYGQDVGGTFGGAFKATKGLAKEFPGRVLNTPISEDAMVGTAIGAALEGMRPIVEMQFADFSSIALNQILNNAGTHQYFGPDHNQVAEWRHQRERPVSFSINGIALCALPGPDRDDTSHRGRRLHHADRCGRH